MDKAVLLTGATGFIGSHVLEKLVDEGVPVVVLKRSTSDTARIAHMLDQVMVYDIDHLGTIDEIFLNHPIDTIIHLATYYKKKHETHDIEPMTVSNILLPVTLLEAAVRFGVRNFINTGTFFEYEFSRLPVCEDTPPQALNLYAMTKMGFETILREYASSGKIRAMTLKIFTPYGPRDDRSKLIPFLIKSVTHRQSVTLSEGFQKLDFVYVEDIARAYIAALHAVGTLQAYETFNIGSGKVFSIRDVVSILEDLVHTVLDKQWGPPSAIDIPIALTSVRKAERLLGWSPQVTLYEGLQKTIDCYREMGI